MPLDFRYHLVSIVAFFGALLIGVLVGIALVGDPDLEKQVLAYTALVEEKDARLQQLESRMRASQTFGKELLPELIRNKLLGRHLAIITNSDHRQDPMVEQLTPLLVGAGARVNSVTTVLLPFVNLVSRDAAPILQEAGYPMPVDRNVRALLAGKMASHIAQGRPELLQRLRARRLIEVQGDYTQPADCIVLVGGYRNRERMAVEAIDLPMVRALQDIGVQVVACEASDAPISTVQYYQSRRISTVDDADTIPGQLALVLAISGVEGDYGVKPTADHLLPPRSQW